MAQLNNSADVSLQSWIETKRFVEHALGISNDALHILVGVSIFFLLAFLLRRPVTHRSPIIGLLFIEVANEAVDLFTERWPSAGMQFGEGVKDLLLTMIVPLAMFTVGRLHPRIFRAPLPVNTDG